MMLTYYGLVESIRRQPAPYPMLIRVKTDIGSMELQAPFDSPDVVGRGITITVEIHEIVSAP